MAAPEPLSLATGGTVKPGRQLHRGKPHRGKPRGGRRVAARKGGRAAPVTGAHMVPCVTLLSTRPTARRTPLSSPTGGALLAGGWERLGATAPSAQDCLQHRARRPAHDAGGWRRRLQAAGQSSRPRNHRRCQRAPKPGPCALPARRGLCARRPSIYPSPLHTHAPAAYRCPAPSGYFGRRAPSSGASISAAVRPDGRPACCTR